MIGGGGTTEGVIPSPSSLSALYQPLGVVRGGPLPGLETWSRVLEGGGAGVVIHKVAHALTGVLHFPAWGQCRLLDHPRH